PDHRAPDRRDDAGPQRPRRRRRRGPDCRGRELPEGERPHRPVTRVRLGQGAPPFARGPFMSGPLARRRGTAYHGRVSRRVWLGVLASLVLATACGGGGAPEPTPTATPTPTPTLPPIATQAPQPTPTPVNAHPPGTRTGVQV